MHQGTLVQPGCAAQESIDGSAVASSPCTCDVCAAYMRLEGHTAPGHAASPDAHMLFRAAATQGSDSMPQLDVVRCLQALSSAYKQLQAHCTPGPTSRPRGLHHIPQQPALSSYNVWQQLAQCQPWSHAPHRNQCCRAAQSQKAHQGICLYTAAGQLTACSSTRVHTPSTCTHLAHAHTHSQPAH